MKLQRLEEECFEMDPNPKAQPNIFFIATLDLSKIFKRGNNTSKSMLVSRRDYKTINETLRFKECLIKSLR